MKLHQELIEKLSKDDRLVIDGKLAKNKVIELALHLDVDLLKILRSSRDLNKTFFQEVDGVLIFDKVKFQSFVSNKQFLPDSFTEYKNKIGLTSDKQYITDNEEIVLSFPYKDCVLEGGQTKEDAKRDEIFWNETLAPDEIDKLLEPKVLTGFKKYDSKGEHAVKEITTEDNLIIKGNNLLVLETLSDFYKEKVKLVYIDPPFNTEGTANTFSYNNSFNHSSWLVFVKNRAEVAKRFLKNTGFFAISIDHAEVLYAGVLLDEIFGRENRIGIITIETNPRGRSDAKFFATSHETLIVYAKDISQASINDLSLTDEQAQAFNLKDEISTYRLLSLRRSGSNSSPKERPRLNYPIFYSEKTGDISVEEKKGYLRIDPIDTSGEPRVWRQSKDTVSEAIKAGDVVINKNNKGVFAVYLKDRLKDGRKPKTFWSNPKYDASSHGTILLQKMFGEKLFSYPKSLFLMEDIISILTDDGDIILDYHGGSATTAHAVLLLNEKMQGTRKFILCEQMDYIKSVTKERTRKVIEAHKNGSFIYAELAEANQLFVDKIQDSKNTKELLKVWDEMKKTAFLSYKVKPEEIDATKKDFESLSFEDQQKFLISTLDKNMLYVPYSEIEDKTYKISKEDIALNKKFYGRD
jgi:adenine-specific DNA-methyltransferase